MGNYKGIIVTPLDVEVDYKVIGTLSGKGIITSPVVKMDKGEVGETVVTTRSGSVYTVMVKE